jgi:hypothetical protein
LIRSQAASAVRASALNLALNLGTVWGAAQGAGLVAAAASTTTLAASTAFAQTNQPSGVKAMPYQAKPMSLDPKSIKGISEKVLVSHYENNYVDAVKRLNAIGAQLAELDFAKAPNFMVNGLKCEELIAAWRFRRSIRRRHRDDISGGRRGSLRASTARFRAVMLSVSRTQQQLPIGQMISVKFLGCGS